MLELRFPSDGQFLPMVTDLARRLGELRGFEADEAERIAMAVDEAATHVVAQAYHGSPDREIEIHFDPKGGCLDIEILHDGDALQEIPVPAFDVPTLVAEPLQGGGGISIVRQVKGGSVSGKLGSGQNTCATVRYRRRSTKGE